MNLFEGNDVQKIGIGDYWGPAGPGNTLFRNRVTGEGITYFDHSHLQNLIGNRTTMIKNDNNSSSNFLEHGNVVNSVTKWNDTIPDRILPNSLYLKEMPSFLEVNKWPAFGPDILPGRKLPAQVRYETILTSAQSQMLNQNELQLTIKKMPDESGVLIGYKLDHTASGNLSVFQIDSRLVSSQPVTEQSGSFIFNHKKAQSNNIYFVRLSTEKGVTVRKFILSN